MGFSTLEWWVPAYPVTSREQQTPPLLGTRHPHATNQ